MMRSSSGQLYGLSIIIVGLHYKPETSGNAPYTAAMAEAIAAAGADVHVVTGIPHYPQWEVTDPRYLKGQGQYWNESDGKIRITRCRHHVPREPDLVGRARLEASFFRRASVVLRRASPSAVIAVTPTLSALGAAVAHTRSLPVGALVQDLTGHAASESGSAGNRVSSLIGSGEYALLRRCDRVGVIADRFGDVLMENGVQPNRIATLSNFSHIQAVHLSPQAARSRLGWPVSRFTVVHTGNMGRKQGLDTLVAAARLSDERGDGIDFVLVGDGNQRRALQVLGADLPNLRFVPPLKTDDYPYALAAADILLLCEAPGVQEMSLPSKLTSYTASCRPIIASVQSGGITEEEVRRFRVALITDAGDPRDLLAGVYQLRDSSARANSLVANAQVMFETQHGRAAAHERYVRFASDLCATISGSGHSDSTPPVGKWAT